MRAGAQPRRRPSARRRSGRRSRPARAGAVASRRIVCVRPAAAIGPASCGIHVRSHASPTVPTVPATDARPGRAIGARSTSGLRWVSTNVVAHLPQFDRPTSGCRTPTACCSSSSSCWALHPAGGGLECAVERCAVRVAGAARCRGTDQRTDKAPRCPVADKCDEPGSTRTDHGTGTHCPAGSPPSVHLLLRSFPVPVRRARCGVPAMLRPTRRRRPAGQQETRGAVRHPVDRRQRVAGARTGVAAMPIGAPMTTPATVAIAAPPDGSARLHPGQPEHLQSATSCSVAAVDISTLATEPSQQTKPANTHGSGLVAARRSAAAGQATRWWVHRRVTASDRRGDICTWRQVETDSMVLDGRPSATSWAISGDDFRRQ